MHSALQRFRSLRPPVRSLVFLYWIYTLTSNLTWVFTQLFIYGRFNNLTVNIVGILVLFTGIMTSFCIFGYLASVYRLNIKHGFLVSFLLFITDLIVLLNATTPNIAYLSLFLNGLGNGFFWLTIHTFEFVETKDHERDYYSSLLSVGDQLFAFVGPACATALIWLSGTLLHWGTFTLLFAVTPAVYLLGFFSFSSLHDYRPQPVKLADVTHFFTDRRNQLFQVFVMGEGFQNVLVPIVMPLVSFTILGTALNVGFYSTLAGIFSVFCILLIAEYRTTENRLVILAGATALLVATEVWLGYAFTFTALVLYTVLLSIVSPLISVSTHVISLQGIESMGRSTSDFYATMLLRDFSLWVWRLVFGLLFLFVTLGLTSSTRDTLPIGVYLIALSLLITLLGAKLVVTQYKKMPVAVISDLPVSSTIVD